MTSQKKALLIVAHGSRRQESNTEIKQIAEKVAERSQATFVFVSAAFLEIADPSIPQGLEQCVANGANEIVVFPYFLSAGRHVVEDIPREVNQFLSSYPDVSVKIASYLGSSETLLDVILSISENT